MLALFHVAPPASVRASTLPGSLARPRTGPDEKRRNCCCTRPRRASWCV